MSPNACAESERTHTYTYILAINMGRVRCLNSLNYGRNWYRRECRESNLWIFRLCRRLTFCLGMLLGVLPESYSRCAARLPAIPCAWNHTISLATNLVCSKGTKFQGGGLVDWQFVQRANKNTAINLLRTSQIEQEHVPAPKVRVCIPLIEDIGSADNLSLAILSGKLFQQGCSHLLCLSNCPNIPAVPQCQRVWDLMKLQNSMFRPIRSGPHARV